MADIELVIKIPEEIYKHILSMQFYIPGSRSGKSLLEKILKAIRTGTPLPKGHGDLVDADKMIKELNEHIQIFDESNNEILKQLGKPEENNQIPLWMWKGCCKTCGIVIESERLGTSEDLLKEINENKGK